MDYGWQNLEPAGRNDSLESLASNQDCTERAAPPQTSNMRDVRSPFAMMISLQLPSTLLPSWDAAKSYAIFSLYGPCLLGFDMKVSAISTIFLKAQNLATHASSPRPATMGVMRSVLFKLRHCRLVTSGGIESSRMRHHYLLSICRQVRDQPSEHEGCTKGARDLRQDEHWNIRRSNPGESIG